MPSIGVHHTDASSADSRSGRHLDGLGEVNQVRITCLEETATCTIIDMIKADLGNHLALVVKVLVTIPIDEDDCMTPDHVFGRLHSEVECSALLSLHHRTGVDVPCARTLAVGPVEVYGSTCRGGRCHIAVLTRVYARIAVGSLTGSVVRPFLKLYRDKRSCHDGRTCDGECRALECLVIDCHSIELVAECRSGDDCQLCAFGHECAAGQLYIAIHYGQSTVFRCCPSDFIVFRSFGNVSLDECRL